jgi:hypothetical protein
MRENMDPLFVIALLLFSALLCELPASQPMRTEPNDSAGALMLSHDEPQVS